MEMTPKVGAENTELYIDKLRNKKVGVVGNQSSLIGETHLVDSLLSLGIDIQKDYLDLTIKRYYGMEKNIQSQELFLSR